jgi:MFS family permease
VVALPVTPSFALLAFAHHQPWEIYLSSGLLGLSMGFVYASMANIIVETVPLQQVGVATGMNTNLRTIGGAIGAAVMSVIVTSTSVHGGYPRDSGYTEGFAVLTIAALLAAVACLFIPRPVRSDIELLSRADVEQPETALVAGAGLVDVE